MTRPVLYISIWLLITIPEHLDHKVSGNRAMQMEKWLSASKTSSVHLTMSEKLTVMVEEITTPMIPWHFIMQAHGIFCYCFDGKSLQWQKMTNSVFILFIWGHKEGLLFPTDCTWPQIWKQKLVSKYRLLKDRQIMTKMTNIEAERTENGTDFVFDHVWLPVMMMLCPQKHWK